MRAKIRARSESLYLRDFFLAETITPINTKTKVVQGAAKRMWRSTS